MTGWKPTAKIIADSISPNGKRLTTMEVDTHRFVLAEFNTHRVFSRNSASSRAIPLEKMLTKAKQSTAWPVSFPAEQPGMQGGEELQAEDYSDACDLWNDVMDSTTTIIYNYMLDHPDKATRLHKSVINRLLEPFLPHRMIISSTEWQGFFDQRVHPAAQPEIHYVAKLMLEAYEESKPEVLEPGEWHRPYVTQEDMEDAADFYLLEEPEGIADYTELINAISVARCARVSYLTHDQKKDLDADLSLYLRLKDHLPPHASPFEHVATPTFPATTVKGNFDGWNQLRHLLGMS